MEAVISQRPDVVVLDLMLPRMGGYEICKIIKSSEELRHTRVVIVSARTRAADQIRGMQEGADAYITKPFRNQEVRAIVARVIHGGGRGGDPE